MRPLRSVSVLIGLTLGLLLGMAEAGGYASPDLLISTEELARQLGASDVRIVDVRVAEEYKAAHIPGAVASADQGDHRH